MHLLDVIIDGIPFLVEDAANISMPVPTFIAPADPIACKAEMHNCSVFKCSSQTVTNVALLTSVETVVVELSGAAFEQVTRLGSMISLWCLGLDHMI